MTPRKREDEWVEHARQVLGDMDRFNAVNPRATWAETEAAVDDALAGIRRELVVESVLSHAVADFRGASERPSCPHCGTELLASGQVTRRVVLRGDVTVDVERTRGKCPGCGAGIFPPGRGTGPAAG